jgi:hypothetical protein
MSPVKNWFKANWVLLLLFLLVFVWQTCTWLYLRNDLSGWLEDHGGDGNTPPKPPPRF